MKIMEIPVSERPREKGLKYGVRTLSTRELLAVLLRSGIKGQSALETADLLLRKAEGIRGIGRMSLEEMRQIPGISAAKALELLACIEFCRRIALEETSQKDVVNHPEILVNWLQKEIGSSLQEEFLVVYLSNSHTIIRYEILFKGTINSSNVYPREVFRNALLLNSTSILLVHNHPGGDLTPSFADMALTGRMIHLGEEMGIHVLDHIIITQSDWISFAALGIMEDCMTADMKK